MDYKLYKTPDPLKRLDTSIPYKKSISDLLLKFNYPPTTENSISRIVTVPWKEYTTVNGGWKIAACQFYQGFQGWRTFVPESDKVIYDFREAIVPLRDAGKRLLKAGLKGLLLGAEEKRVVYHPVQDKNNFMGLSIHRV